MESERFKQRLTLIFISSVALYAINKVYNKLNSTQKRQFDHRYANSDSESDIMSSDYDELSQTSSSHPLSDISSQTSVTLVANGEPTYVSRNKMVMTLNGEIIAKPPTKDVDESSNASFNVPLNRQSRNTAKLSNKLQRQQNAKEFLRHLRNVKNEVVVTKTTGKRPLKTQRGQKLDCFMLNEDLETMSIAESVMSDDQIENLPTFDHEQESDFEQSKTLMEKFTKEKAMRRKVKVDAKPEMVKTKPKKVKKSKRDDLKLNSKDLSNKNDYVFFEVLATYADAYIQNSSKKD